MGLKTTFMSRSARYRGSIRGDMATCWGSGPQPRGAMRRLGTLGPRGRRPSLGRRRARRRQPARAAQLIEAQCARLAGARGRCILAGQKGLMSALSHGSATSPTSTRSRRVNSATRSDCGELTDCSFQMCSGSTGSVTAPSRASSSRRQGEEALPRRVMFGDPRLTKTVTEVLSRIGTGLMTTENRGNFRPEIYRAPLASRPCSINVRD